jgi:hypothetical protein
MCCGLVEGGRDETGSGLDGLSWYGQPALRYMARALRVAKMALELAEDGRDANDANDVSRAGSDRLIAATSPALATWRRSLKGSLRLS